MIFGFLVQIKPLFYLYRIQQIKVGKVIEVQYQNSKKNSFCLNAANPNAKSITSFASMIQF